MDRRVKKLINFLPLQSMYTCILYMVYIESKLESRIVVGFVNSNYTYKCTVHMSALNKKL